MTPRTDAPSLLACLAGQAKAYLALEWANRRHDGMIELSYRVDPNLVCNANTVVDEPHSTLVASALRDYVTEQEVREVCGAASCTISKHQDSRTTSHRLSYVVVHLTYEPPATLEVTDWPASDFKPFCMAEK